MRTFLKVFAGIVTLLILSFGGVFGYHFYQDWSLDQQHLNFPIGNMDKWKWQRQSHRIQIHESSGGGNTLLRRVSLEKQYAVVAYLEEDYTLSASAMWLVDCDPGQTIITSQTFSDGTPQILGCRKVENETFLFAVGNFGTNYDAIWMADYDGFGVYADFKNWDFAQLKRELTLRKNNIRTK